MLHIPVCCDRGTVCPHTFMGQCSRPSECQHSTASGPKREYWSGGRRVGGRQAVYLLSSAARNLKGGADELSWTASLSICDLSSSLVPSPPLRPPSRKEAVVVKHSARFLCTSSVSSLSEKQKQKWFWTLFYLCRRVFGFSCHAPNIQFEVFFLHFFSQHFSANPTYI